MVDIWNELVHLVHGVEPTYRPSDGNFILGFDWFSMDFRSFQFWGFSVSGYVHGLYFMSILPGVLFFPAAWNHQFEPFSYYGINGRPIKKHIVIINSNSFWLVRGAPEQISEVTSPNLNHIPSIAMFINAQSLIPVYPTQVKSTIIQGTTIPDRPPILEVSFGNQLVLVDIQWHESQTLVRTVAPIPAFASTSATAPMSVVQAMDWNSFQRTHNKKKKETA